MKFRVTQNVSTESWEELVNSSSAATLFHSALWMSVAPERWRRLAVSAPDGRVLAGCVIEDTVYRQVHGASLSPYQGPFLRQNDFSTTRASSRSFALLHAIARQLTVSASNSFVSSPWLNDLRPFVIGRWNISLLYTYVLRGQNFLRPEAVIDSVCRSTIRAAERQGLNIEVKHPPDESAIHHLLELTEQSYRRQGREVRFDQAEAVATFLAVAKAGQCAFVFAKEPSSQISAGVGVVWHRHRAHLLISGRDPAESKNCSGTYCLWKAINLCREFGIEEFDFEGSFLPGVERFFRQFGGELVPFYELSHP